MNKQEEQEHIWNLLIENELYSILEDAENDLKRENLLAEYCEAYGISVQFARNKIERMKQSKAQREQEAEQEEDER